MCCLPLHAQGLLRPTIQTPLFSQQVPQRFVSGHWKSRGTTIHLQCLLALQAAVTALPGDTLPGLQGPASCRKAAPKGSKPLTLQKRAKTPQRGLCRMQVDHRKLTRTNDTLVANTTFSTTTGHPPKAIQPWKRVAKTLQPLPNLKNSLNSSCSKEELTSKCVCPLAVINHGLADKRILRNTAGRQRGLEQLSKAVRMQSVFSLEGNFQELPAQWSAAP